MLHAAGFARGVECAGPERAGDGLPDPLDEEIETARGGIVSPDENAHRRTVIIGPLTSSGTAYPFRAPCAFDGKQGLIVLDQIRTVDRERLLCRWGAVSETELDSTLALLREMFDA